MTELRVKFTKGFVKRAAAVAMAVCLGATLIPSGFVKADETSTGSEQKVGYADLTGTGLSVNKTEMTVGDTATATLTVKAKVSNDSEVSGNIVSGNKDASGNVELEPKWSSSKEVEVKGEATKVAVKNEETTVEVTATVTAKSAGTATVSVTLGQKTYNSTITVKASDSGNTGGDGGNTEKPQTVAVTGVTVTPATVTLDKIGATAKLTAAVAPANATVKDVTWTSANAAVAKVANDGTVTAVADGEAVITVTTKDGNKTATAKVTVKSTDEKPADEKPVVKKVSKVAITLNGQTVKGTLKAKVGKSYSFKTTVTPKDAANKKVTWKSSNTKVATVNSSGKVKVKKAGKATITATAKDGSKKSAKITLNASKNKVKVSKVAIKGNKTMKVKKSQTLKVTVTPATADNTKVTWKSSNKKVATVNSKGKVTAKKKGTVTITATAKDGSKKKATIKIKVK